MEKPSNSIDQPNYKEFQEARKKVLERTEGKPVSGRVIPGGGARGGAHQLALGLVPPRDPQPEFFEEGHDSLRAFQSPLANSQLERDKLSNLFNLWESIPKYSASALAGKHARSVGEPLPIIKHQFEHDGDVFEMKLTPAQFQEEVDGKETNVFYYPGANEELVEMMLIKFAMEKAEIFEPTDASKNKSAEKHSYGVAFSLSSLREFMYSHRKARTYNEIRHALHVLHKTNLEVSVNGKMMASASLLPELYTFAQRGFKKHDPASQWAARFHPMVSSAINNGTYRQFNLDRLLKTRSKLALCLSKIILASPRNISTTTPLRLNYLDFVAKTGELQYSRRNEGVRKFIDIAKTLKKYGMVSEVSVELAKNRNGKIFDATLEIFATEDFVKEIRASYKRNQLLAENPFVQIERLKKAKESKRQAKT